MQAPKVELLEYIEVDVNMRDGSPLTSEQLESENVTRRVPIEWLPYPTKVRPLPKGPIILYKLRIPRLVPLYILPFFQPSLVD